MLAPSSGITARLGDDRFHTYDAPLGMVVVNPAGWDSEAKWQSTRSNIVIAIPQASMLDLAAHEFDRGGVELRPPSFGTVDHMALRAARAIKSELERGEEANDLIIDSLITLFGVHVLRKYGSVCERAFDAKGGLSPRNARLVQDFLKDHFFRKLSISELAALTDLSPAHFIRAFSKTFGMPPYRYVTELRLAAAETFLLKGDLTIADIALLTGFSSQSHLTATMRKYRQTTPAQIKSSR